MPALCAHGIVAHNLIARGNPAHAWPALIRQTIRQLFSSQRELAGFPVAARSLALSGADGEWDRLGSAHGSAPLGELLTSSNWRTEMRSGLPWVASTQPGPTAIHRAAGEGKCAAKKSQDHCWHPSGSVN